MAERLTGVDSYEYFECAEEVVFRSQVSGDLLDAEKYQYIVRQLTKKLYGDENAIVALPLRNLADILRAANKDLHTK